MMVVLDIGSEIFDHFCACTMKEMAKTPKCALVDKVSLCKKIWIGELNGGVKILTENRHIAVAVHAL